MQRMGRPEGLDLPPPQLQRNQSTASDLTPSIFGSSSLMSPPSVNPEPAYIAASAATQIVNNDRADRGQDSFAGQELDADVDTAIISPGSLVLINTFLDQLLFSFLASSRSTFIASLRPAILEVLKPRLGKEAIDGADEELQGYLAGGDAEELLAFHSGQEFKGEYNLNLLWRRTRLRCMVYTRLGDMEEEDEEMYLEQESEANGDDERPRVNRDLGSVSPAAAIFLTSILEFIGEQALFVASEAASNRMQMRRPSSKNSRAVVEEVDMEKIAFNTTLGRLWRSWKKRVRSSSLLSPRPGSRDMLRPKSNSVSGGGSASGNTSISEENESGYFDPARQPSVAEVLNKDQRSTPVPRPKARDLPDEPDFSGFSMESPLLERQNLSRDRPRSMVDYRKTAGASPERSPVSPISVTDERRPVQRRQRSSSVPAKQSPYVSPIDETFTTPTEGPDPSWRENDRAEAENEMPKLTDDSKTVPGSDNANQAVSTMYDGAISHEDEPLPETMVERNDRGISTYTESLNYTDEYDNELAPQALNLDKTTENVSAQLRDSQASISSNYSLLVGDLTPSNHPGGLSQNPAGKENEYEGDPFSRRNGSLNQPSIENDRSGVGNLANLSALQGHQLRTYDESGQAVKRDIPVLYEASSNEDVIYNPEASVRSSTGAQDEDRIKTPTKAVHQAVDEQKGVPTLTPLRELIDVAHDTSDEGSSSAPSHEAPKADSFTPSHRYQGSDGVRAVSVSSSTFNQGQPRTSTSRMADVRSQPAAINTGAERAAVQRVSPSSGTHISRTSTSSNRDGRPMTAGSTHSHVSSKIKGMVGRESTDQAQPPLPQRTSSEGSGSLIRTPNKEQDFEELIKSDETVKYTLTPQNMREMETPDSPRWQTNSRSQTSELAGGLRNSTRSSVEPEQPFTSKSLAKLKGLNGLRSNPVDSISPTTSTHASTISRETSTSQPKPIPKTAGPRSPSAIAREPITKDDSLRDFADFIRSTGPDAPPKPLQKPATSGSARTSRPGSSSAPFNGNGKPLPKKITKQSPGFVPKKPEAQPQGPGRNTSKLQAREPTVVNNNSTADLADFLRSGPVGGQVDGSRSQRSGATGQQPAGSGLPNGRMKEAVNSGSSVASTQDSFAPSKMTQSSTNSRTGLLDSSNRAQHTGSPGVRNSIQRPARNDEPPGQGRTLRQPRDPYSIDSDDDVEDRYSTPQPPHEREEESLSDFLRNYHPPPEATTTRNAPSISGAPKPPKQTTPTIRERLARNIAVVPDYRPLPPKTPKKPSSSSKSPPQSNESRKSAQRTMSAQQRSSPTTAGYSPPNQNNIVRGRSTDSAPQLPPINPRATSPHLISQNGSKIDSYRPTQPTYAKHVDRAPRKQMRAREERGVLGGGMSGSGMSDLADFLRETEPPKPSGPVAARPMSPVKEKEESAFGRMFGRGRKKDVR